MREIIAGKLRDLESLRDTEGGLRGEDPGEERKDNKRAHPQELAAEEQGGEHGVDACKIAGRGTFPRSGSRAGQNPLPLLGTNQEELLFALSCGGMRKPSRN